MTAGARIAIGVPLYNGSGHLPEALESLLAQTHSDFSLVLLDDCSLDATAEVVARYDDPRIHYERNDRRLGLIGSWVRVFERARELNPGMEYFAWASDHDAWHPRWLETLLAELEADPRLVVAYPRSVGVLDDGEIVHRPRPFDSSRMEDPVERVMAAAREANPGSLVYGLMRANVLADCGVYRRVREPDRLLVAELALRGRFRQVPHVLYFRRRGLKKPTKERQRASCFPDGAPLHVLLPWPATYAAVLAWSALRGVRGGLEERLRVSAAAAAFYLRFGIRLELWRLVKAQRRRPAVRFALGVRKRLARWRRHRLGASLPAPQA